MHNSRIDTGAFWYREIEKGIKKEVQNRTLSFETSQDMVIAFKCHSQGEICSHSWAIDQPSELGELIQQE